MPGFELRLNVSTLAKLAFFTAEIEKYFTSDDGSNEQICWRQRLILSYLKTAI
jgi:hypothetical protein